MSRLAFLLFAVAFLIATVSAFPRWHQLENYKFEHYVQEANRGYVKGSSMWRYRERLFNNRLEDIKKHNKDSAMTWKRGINQFSDWSASEWREYNRARLPKETDFPKDVKIRSAQEDPSALPRFVDYRNRVEPRILTGVKNQGSCGSCWAHSSTESIESYFALTYGQLPVLSVQQVTSCTASMSGCGGGSYVQGWDYVAKDGGLNEEFTYPYVDFFAPQMSWNNTQKCQNITKKFPTIHDGSHSFVFTWWPKANISGYTRVERNNATAMMEALARVGPQAISVASDTWSDYESGILKNNYTNKMSNYSWQAINHDVQMVGYGYDFGLDLNYWIVRNSWGTNYGEQGYIRLDRPKHEPCGDLTGSKICGTSGVLCNPGYPHVTDLEKKNGFYF